jgi:hypothetical protein
MGQLRVNEEWALVSIQTLPMTGAKGPARFVSALVSSFDNGAWANYVSWRFRFPEGPYLTVILDRFNAARFPAAGDAERLYRIGNTFQLKQYEFESSANFELRCGTAWDLHGDGGTSIAVRKAFEAYGFPQVEILEECDYPLLSDGSDYGWAELMVVGPNYGDLPIEGCILDTCILDSPNAYLGTGTFSKERIDDVVRDVVLEWRQVHDMPIAIAFRFGTPAILDMVTLDNVTLDDVNDGVEFAFIKGAHFLDEVCLDESTLDGFGV